MQFEAILSPAGVTVFYKIISGLSRIWKEVSFSTNYEYSPISKKQEPLLQIISHSENGSSVVIFTFQSSFFESFKIPTDGNLEITLPTKTLLKPFKSHAMRKFSVLEKLIISLDPQGNGDLIEFRFKNNYTTHIHLFCVDGRSVLYPKKDSYKISHEFDLPIDIVRLLLKQFPAPQKLDLDEVNIIVGFSPTENQEQQGLLVMESIEPEAASQQAARPNVATLVRLEESKLLKFCPDPTLTKEDIHQVTIQLREVRNCLSIVESLATEITLNMHGCSEPVFFSTQALTPSSVIPPWSMELMTVALAAGQTRVASTSNSRVNTVSMSSATQKKNNNLPEMLRNANDFVFFPEAIQPSPHIVRRERLTDTNNSQQRQLSQVSQTQSKPENSSERNILPFQSQTPIPSKTVIKVESVDAGMALNNEELFDNNEVMDFAASGLNAASHVDHMTPSPSPEPLKMRGSLTKTRLWQPSHSRMSLPAPAITGERNIVQDTYSQKLSVKNILCRKPGGEYMWNGEEKKGEQGEKRIEMRDGREEETEKPMVHSEEARESTSLEHRIDSAIMSNVAAFLDADSSLPKEVLIGREVASMDISCPPHEETPQVYEPRLPFSIPFGSNKFIFDDSNSDEEDFTDPLLKPRTRNEVFSGEIADRHVDTNGYAYETLGVSGAGREQQYDSVDYYEDDIPFPNDVDGRDAHANLSIDHRSVENGYLHGETSTNNQRIIDPSSAFIDLSDVW